ncbi:hypothetical protein JK363_24130 [Streptomyces sp. 205]|uniref:Uncharacterized protein n=1 Tax=Streptomyces coffeae TaxID=621382 RepID=A0ABS1NII5_9ACTN|nr:hypothetical protein [Streptomyces coffeae]
MRDDTVTRLPVRHTLAGAQHDAGQVGPDYVVGEVMPLRCDAGPPVPGENWKVGIGSNMALHTVLWFMELAITATNA